MAAELPTQDEDLAPIAGINVTPFVDVVLVLLVIFMITAPMILKDALRIQLPKAASVDTKAAQTLGVVVTKQGEILLNGKPVVAEALAEAVRAALAQDPATQAVISADVDARHGDVVRAIDLVKSAGLSHFAIEIQREKP